MVSFLSRPKPGMLPAITTTATSRLSATVFIRFHLVLIVLSSLGSGLGDLLGALSAMADAADMFATSIPSPMSPVPTRKPRMRIMELRWMSGYCHLRQGRRDFFGAGLLLGVGL